jgi:hypothetical protein
MSAAAAVAVAVAGVEEEEEGGGGTCLGVNSLRLPATATRLFCESLAVGDLCCGLCLTAEEAEAEVAVAKSGMGVAGGGVVRPACIIA